MGSFCNSKFSQKTTKKSLKIDFFWALLNEFSKKVERMRLGAPRGCTKFDADRWKIQLFMAKRSSSSWAPMEGLICLLIVGSVIYRLFQLTAAYRPTGTKKQRRLKSELGLHCLPLHGNNKNTFINYSLCWSQSHSLQHFLVTGRI